MRFPFIEKFSSFVENNGSSQGPGQGVEDVYHPGVTCDGCEMGIRGPRFKCVVCPDYDLCKKCEKRGFHPEHDFMKIRKPKFGRSGHGVSTMYREN